MRKGAESITQGITLGGERLLSVMDIWHARVSGLICPTACINSPLKLGRGGTIEGTSEVTPWFYFLSLWHACKLTHRRVHTLISCVSLGNKSSLGWKIQLGKSLFISFHQGPSLSLGKLWSSFRTWQSCQIYTLACIYLTSSNEEKMLL